MIFLLAAMLLPGAGTAEENPSKRILVFCGAGDVFSQADAEWAAAALEGLSNGFEPLDLENVLGSETLTAARESLQQAHQLLAQAAEAYQQLELTRAQDLFARAREILPAAAPAAGRQWIELWRETLSWLGAVMILDNRLQAGQQVFAQLAATIPSARLDEKEFPPRLVGIFDSVAEEVRKAATYRLEVFTAPSGSRVYLDGQFSCLSPCQVEAKGGTHLVLLKKTAYESVVKTVTLESDEKLKARLPDLPGAERLQAMALAAASGERPPDAAFIESMGKSGAGYFLGLTLWRAGTLNRCSLTLFDGRGQRLGARELQGPAQSKELAAGLLGAAIDLLQGGKGVLESSSFSAAVSGPLSGEEALPSAQPFWKRWWFWTALGAGAAAAVTLAIVLTRPAEPRGILLLEF
jgi:hypothetical protein